MHSTHYDKKFSLENHLKAELQPKVTRLKINRSLEKKQNQPFLWIQLQSWDCACSTFFYHWMSSVWLPESLDTLPVRPGHTVSTPACNWTMIEDTHATLLSPPHSMLLVCTQTDWLLVLLFPLTLLLCCTRTAMTWYQDKFRYLHCLQFKNTFTTELLHCLLYLHRIQL